MNNASRFTLALKASLFLDSAHALDEDSLAVSEESCLQWFCRKGRERKPHIRCFRQAPLREHRTLRHDHSVLER